MAPSYAVYGVKCERTSASSNELKQEVESIFVGNTISPHDSIADNIYLIKWALAL